jgi:hypothetical protein
MLNLSSGAMEENDNVLAPTVQQTYSAKYCKVRRLNHLHLVEFLTADADTEYVAMQIDQSCRHSDKSIRWGTLYRACMDSGIFAPMEVAKFHKILTNLIPGFKFDRSTIAKGVFEYDSRSGELRRGEFVSPDNLTFIKSKEQLEIKLRSLIGS